MTEEGAWQQRREVSVRAGAHAALQRGEPRTHGRDASWRRSRSASSDVAFSMPSGTVAHWGRLVRDAFPVDLRVFGGSVVELIEFRVRQRPARARAR
jgi:hypothetical protein